MFVIETICERCGQVNDHLTAHCPALSLPLCRTCGDQHIADRDCIPGAETLMAAWRRSLLDEVLALQAVTEARRQHRLPF